MYGSFRKDPRLRETYIDHKVLHGETLQGIALKYGASMEQLKRANKIWTNDSLALRDVLRIPAPAKKEGESGDEKEEGGARGGEACPEDVRVSCEGAEATVRDVKGVEFLKRFDSSIAQIKSNVQKLETESRLLEHLESGTPTRIRKTARYSSSASLSSSEDPFGHPELVIKCNGRRSVMDDRTETEERFYQL